MLVTGAACFAPEIPDGAIACGAAGCPDGLSCASDGFCYRDPAAPDSPPDAGTVPDPTGPDAMDPGGPQCAPAPIDDYCAKIPPLAEPPSIDGELDCGLALQTVPHGYWLGEGSAPPSDHQARFAAAWRADGLYVYVEVTDSHIDPAWRNDPTYMGDAVEIYVDGDGSFGAPPSYDAPGTAQFVITAPEDGAPTQRAEVFVDTQLRGAWESTSFLAVPRSGGYAVEAFVSNADLGIPDRVHAAGQRAGFDLAINESRDQPGGGGGPGGGDDDYLGQYYLRIAAGAQQPYPWHNVDAFCVPSLISPTSL